MPKYLVLRSEADKLESWDEHELTVFMSTDDGPKRLDGIIFKQAERLDSKYVRLALTYNLPPPPILDEVGKENRRTLSIVYGKEYDSQKIIMRIYHCHPITSRLNTSPLLMTVFIEGILESNEH